MVLRLVVLDFDGTLTRVDRDSVPFVGAYKDDIRKELGMTRDALEPKWEEKAKIIAANQDKYGWLIDGRIVAPAYADSFIMTQTVASLILDDRGHTSIHAERRAFLDALFRKNYAVVTTTFKDGVDDFLTALKSAVDVCIVTNSETDSVSHKLGTLSDRHADIPICGGAKKYVIHPDWEEVPESVDKPGYGRPIFIRRRNYWEVLKKLMQERGVKREEVLIVGDIYELNLSLPEQMGMSIILTPRPSTPDFEMGAVESASNGKVVSDLKEVLEYIGRVNGA
ncbi:MAG: HAD family hydrolase [Candidatus Woesearchaeota archaeon]